MKKEQGESEDHPVPEEGKLNSNYLEDILINTSFNI
jgi:hypothetical protein